MMNHNRPLAAVVQPAPEVADQNALDDIWGAMEGMLTVEPGVDIAEPVDVEWNALK